MQGPGQVARILVAILAEDDALDVRLAGAVGDGMVVLCVGISQCPSGFGNTWRE